MAEEQEDKDITCQDSVFTGANVKNEKTQLDNEQVDPCLDVMQQCSDDASSSSTPANEAPTNDCDADLAKGDHLHNTVNNDPAAGESDDGCKGDSTKDEKTIPEMDSCPTDVLKASESEEEINSRKQKVPVKETNVEPFSPGIIQPSDSEVTEVDRSPRGEDPTTNKTNPEAAALQIPPNGHEEEVDGLEAEISVKSPAAKDTNKEAEEDGLNSSESEEEINEQMNSQKQNEPDVKDTNVETIGPDIIQPSDSEVTEVGRSPRGLFSTVSRGLLMAGILLVIAFIVQRFLQPESPSLNKDLCQIDIFLKQMAEVKTQYPNQRSELWKRSEIHLKRHLNNTQPTEPVSLILTAGVRAERTLHCLAQSLASAFSSALNASVLHIDGASQARQDSDRVKLDIDGKLQRAFEGDKPVAVIHRFEELPPGSTLIFYRYCDHENAAYKKTFLIFTVLLAEEEEIPAETRLSAVEEMVDDHLQKKFLSRGPPASFDRMDRDKYGGLWSRISHVILPVAAEESKELKGC